MYQIRMYLVSAGRRTFRPWTHTSDDSYMYQLSLVVATATIYYKLSLLLFRRCGLVGISNFRLVSYGAVQCSADLERREPYNTVQWGAHLFFSFGCHKVQRGANPNFTEHYLVPWYPGTVFPSGTLR